MRTLAERKTTPSAFSFPLRFCPFVSDGALFLLLSDVALFLAAPDEEEALLVCAFVVLGRLRAFGGGLGFFGSKSWNGLDNGGIPSGRAHGRGGMNRVCFQGQCSERRSSVRWY